MRMRLRRRVCAVAGTGPEPGFQDRKDPEPFPKFIPGFVDRCARDGALRFGVLRVDGEPAAAQIWIVSNGQATIYKLAYDEKYKDLSVGSILTEWIARRVIEGDDIQEVDFGAGDDTYKKDWTAERRERWGIVAFNPATLSGAIGALRHVGAHRLKALLKGDRRQPTPSGSLSLRIHPPPSMRSAS